MKPYFIGQGTAIVAQFDTINDMLQYHKDMPDIDRHFCKLYDHNKMKFASGNDILFNRGWRDWN